MAGERKEAGKSTTSSTPTLPPEVTVPPSVTVPPTVTAPPETTPPVGTEPPNAAVPSETTEPPADTAPPETTEPPTDTAPPETTEGQPGGQNDQDQNDPGPALPTETEMQVNAAGDRFNANTVTAAVNTSAPGRAQKAGEEENAFFDSLPLEEDNVETAEGADMNGEGQLRERIQKFRKGNLYKAVLVGKLLKEGKKNPMASTAGARVSRFLDSSAMDTASDVNLIAGIGVGMLTSFNTNSAATKTFQAMSLVTNAITLLSTCRNMGVKVKKLYDLWQQHKAGQHASKIDAALTVLGMAGDALTLIVKGVAIIKTIVSLAGKNSKILNMISNAMFLLTGTTQIIGALNGIRGLQKSYQGLKGLKAASENPRAAAMRVIEEKNNLTAGATDSWSESERIKATKELLTGKKDENNEHHENNEDQENPPAALSEEEKDCLIIYLGMTKRITKMERTLAVSATSLINLTIAFTSTAVGGANTTVSKFGEKNSTLQDAAKGMGMVANASNILATSAKLADRAAGSVSAARGSSSIVKQSLWGKIVNLTENNRGLKWLDHSLAKPPAQRRPVGGKKPEEAAAETIALYTKTEGQFNAMGVPYAKLIQANSKSKFQNLLVDKL